MENLNDYTCIENATSDKELGIKNSTTEWVFITLTHAEKYAANLYDMDSLFGDPEIHFYAKIR